MKYRKEFVSQILKHLSEGMTREDACILSGINKDTFYEWLHKSEFSDAVLKAEISCKQRNIRRVQKASKVHWSASAWWLERKYPEEFAEKSKHEISGPNGTPLIGLTVNLDLSKLSDDKLNLLADQFAKRLESKKL